ncbi:hypothetical protein H3T48_00670 [Lactobacillus sp. M0403]|uniref:hypothetical protein n=1 Tax=Lactobacillus TaxID=1578 RepID=UPI001650CB1F|nr:MULTISPECIES: hypothetical protein [Lactobacillus]MBC6361580.1 hypothetical protein [Lactobacillus apis]MBI0092220.1 hypothetical protein [Lactobacillus sp. M0403]
MQSALLVVLLLLAFGLSWVAEVKLRKKLLTQLLTSQKNGDQKRYFQLLKSPVAVVCLSAKAREFLSLDYYLAYEDYDQVCHIVAHLTEKPVDLTKEKEQDLLIRLMRCYLFYLDSNHSDKAIKLEEYLLNNCKLPEVRAEVQELHQVYLAPDREVLAKLKEQLDTTEEPQQQLIIYQRLVKVTEELGLKKQAKEYLEKMRELAQTTIKMEEFKDDKTNNDGTH